MANPLSFFESYKIRGLLTRNDRAFGREKTKKFSEEFTLDYFIQHRDDSPFNIYQLKEKAEHSLSKRTEDLETLNGKNKGETFNYGDVLRGQQIALEIKEIQESISVLEVIEGFKQYADRTDTSSQSQAQLLESYYKSLDTDDKRKQTVGKILNLNLVRGINQELPGLEEKKNLLEEKAQKIRRAANCHFDESTPESDIKQEKATQIGSLISNLKRKKSGIERNLSKDYKENKEEVQEFFNETEKNLNREHTGIIKYVNLILDKILVGPLGKLKNIFTESNVESKKKEPLIKTETEEIVTQSQNRILFR